MIIGNDFDNIYTDFFLKKYAFYFCKKKVYIIIHMTKNIVSLKYAHIFLKRALPRLSYFFHCSNRPRCTADCCHAPGLLLFLLLFLLFNPFIVIHFRPLTFFSFNSILSCYVNIILNLILALYAVCITLILCFAKFGLDLSI